MNTSCCSTPYSLNFKLKKLYKYPSYYTKNADINILYKNLNNSIPSITNHLCILKKKTRELNKSLNQIPIVYNNNAFISKRANYSFYSPKCIKTFPYFSNYDNNYYYNSSYISPKPVLKQYNCNCNFDNNNNHHIDNILNYKYNTNYDKDNNMNNQVKLNFNYIPNLHEPIKIQKYPSYNPHHNRAHSAINMNKSNYKYKSNINNNYANNINNDIGANKLCASCYNRNDNNISKISNFTNGFNNNMNKSSVVDAKVYERQLNALNEELYEKDKMINKMQGLIDNTFDQLNQKNKENSILQSELLELKKKGKIKNENPNENKR